MSYRSILTILDNSNECAGWVKYAIELAKQHGARLVGVAPCEIASSLSFGEMVSIDSAWIIDLQENIDKNAKNSISDFEKQCREEGFDAYEAKIVSGSDYTAMRHETFNNDLIVLGQHSDDFKGTKAGLIESLLMGAARPLLIVPSIGTYEARSENILLAWRDNRESAMAIRQSIPQLKYAAKVEIVTVDNHKPDASEEKKLQELVAYLALNNIEATYRYIISDLDAGNVLLSHACDFGANLLVMGGYGHTRIKEWALGGATRTILQSMTLPVLMAH